ncbi:hypothetical protein [Psychroflexus halocasei]|uniref:Uncharacterized protein n=1 Tax=Psychroflexus halocasei TaxID=908615 RepID=A0A1H4DR11_9FLAO|nr:hypothetical protein [Psychroflexus halocasei]SEA75184.1 hypothetical protein SAMN05421540_1142 [Psychroflexus halocasei]
MYLTHSFVAVKKGDLDYLMFYITEDYVEQQVKLKEQLNPLLEDLGRNLLDRGAVVKAFDRDLDSANEELTEKFDQDFTREIIISFDHQMEKPGLLILNSDIENFDPKNHKWIYVSFREFLDEYGGVKIYKLKEMFDILTSAIKENKDLFKEAENHLKKEKAISAHKMVELKPGIFGISLDLKETFNFFNQLRNK